MKADDPEAVCISAAVDETSLMRSEIEKRAFFHAFRLLCGACVDKDLEGRWLIRSCGQEYIVTEEAYAIYDRVRARVQKEELDLRGVRQPFNTEDTIRVMHSAMRIASSECKIPPNKLRVYFLRMDSGGCGFYRVMQPVRALGNHPWIQAEESDWLSFPLGQNYDVIIAPRVSHPLTIATLRNLQRAGKVVIYECDDLMSQLPDWNPAKGRSPLASLFREEFIKTSTGIICSTPQLREALDRPEVTQVCLNGINENLWPMKVRTEKSDKVRILWAGSNTHEDDLKTVVPAIKRIIKIYGSKVEFIWVAYAPSEFTCGYNHAGKISLGIQPEYEKNMKLIPGVPVIQWPAHLASMNADICIAPLASHPFNESKSEIKVLESWAMGLPIVATDIAPYARAITNRKNGFLIHENDCGAWVMTLRELIDSPERRQEMASEGLKVLHEKYTTPSIVRSYENALATLCDGKILRPECQAEISKHMNEVMANEPALARCA